MQVLTLGIVTFLATLAAVAIYWATGWILIPLLLPVAMQFIAPLVFARRSRGDF